MDSVLAKNALKMIWPSGKPRLASLFFLGARPKMSSLREGGVNGFVTMVYTPFY